MPLAISSLITEEEYLKGELIAEIKHQFIDGEIYVMAGASADHNRISVSFASEFQLQLKGSACEPFIADMKVKADNNFFYPDVMVTCDEHENDTQYVKHAPKLIVEVLSRSTRIFDHSIKQEKYLNISSLEYYVLVEQDFCEVQVLSRAAGFIPKYYYLGDDIPFPLINVTIKVNDIYDRVDNEDKQKYLESLLAEKE